MAEERKDKFNRGRRGPAEEREFDQKIIDLARVTRVMAGGKRMRFRACVVIGDKKGRLGYGIAKGADVQLAVNKAVSKAKKDMIELPIVKGTILYSVQIKYKAAMILLKPAPEGSGVVAGGPVRAALELSGIGNIVAKMYGSKNKINNIRALFKAFAELKRPLVKSVASIGNSKLGVQASPSIVASATPVEPEQIPEA